MNCIFCQQMLLPTTANQGDNSYKYQSWICVNCVVKYQGSMEKHSILRFYKKHWYEFDHIRSENKYILYCLDSYELPNYITGEVDQRINRVLLKDVSPLENITPENAQQKLTTILTFL